MMWGYGEGGWPLMHGFGWFFMVLLTVLVVLGILALFRGLSRGGRGMGRGGMHRHGGDPALTILRERYARGEITLEQLEQMTKHLT